MDEAYARRPLVSWFWAGAILSLMFMLAICALWGVNLTTDPATLTLDERALYEAEPRWVSAAFGVTGLTGTVGALLLLMRRKEAVAAFLLSLVASALWFAGLLLVPQLRHLLLGDEIAMAVVILAITWTIYWFARHSRQRGWLR